MPILQRPAAFRKRETEENDRESLQTERELFGNRSRRRDAVCPSGIEEEPVRPVRQITGAVRKPERLPIFPITLTLRLGTRYHRFATVQVP
jgi:hypothetical protein